MMDNKQSDLVIMGIDPGTNVLGYSIIRSSGKNLSIEAMGVIDLRKCADIYLKLGRIHQNMLRLIDTFHPDELAIESPFFGKNIQSAIKLGRAQGVAIAAAIERDLVVHEYPPTKVKLAITGNGSASKEQVAGMLQRLLHIAEEDMPKFLDATDALGAAYCHFMQMGAPKVEKSYKSWKDLVTKNPDKVV